MCKVWIRGSADILAYTDVDISTELEVLERNVSTTLRHPRVAFSEPRLVSPGS